MPTAPRQIEFEDALRARLTALRKAKNWTQLQTAEALGIQHETYKKYETRSTIPTHLLPRLALLFDRTVDYLLTGRELRSRPTQVEEVGFGSPAGTLSLSNARADRDHDAREYEQPREMERRKK